MVLFKGKSIYLFFGCLLAPFIIIGFAILIFGIIALSSGMPGLTILVNGVPTNSPEFSIFFGLIFIIFPLIIFLPFFLCFKMFSMNLKLSTAQNNNVSISKDRKSLDLYDSRNNHSDSPSYREESNYSDGRCSNCGGAIQKGEKKCWNCGVRI